eukprot:986904-Pleurochrysis_carterae.AAC.2
MRQDQTEQGGYGCPDCTRNLKMPEPYCKRSNYDGSLVDVVLARKGSQYPFPAGPVLISNIAMLARFGGVQGLHLKKFAPTFASASGLGLSAHSPRHN